MTLNDAITLPADKPLSSSEFFAMEKMLRPLRASGEIHVASAGEGLVLELLYPHHAIDGYELEDEGLAKRGIGQTLRFEGLSKIAFATDQIVLFPNKIPGEPGSGRKRTIKLLKRGWVYTMQAFFADFQIIDPSGSHVPAMGHSRLSQTAP